MTASKVLHLTRVALLVLFAATTTVSYAHHSFGAEFDPAKPIKMSGVVTRLEWTNPHVYLWVDVTDKAGKVSNWGFEMGPPHMLQKAGWKKNSLTLGESVDVEGWLARDGSNHANARRVTRKSTGEVLGAASSGGQTLTGGSGSKPATPAAPAPPAKQGSQGTR